MYILLVKNIKHLFMHDYSNNAAPTVTDTLEETPNIAFLCTYGRKNRH